MIKESNILIAGGDMRQIYCAKRLSLDLPTAVIGFDNEFIPLEMYDMKTDTMQKHCYDCVVLPVIPLDENGMLNTPYSSSELRPEYIRDMLREDGTVFVGKADERLRSIFSGFGIYEYLNREELSLKNAVPTAEGAVQIALEELPVTINGLRVLIVGLGRIGTALAAVLKGFGADVTAAVRSERGAAKARIAGIRHISSLNIDGSYDLVFNTVPELIFDRGSLTQFSGSTLFIDLASKPGGIDFEAARELGIKAVWALGLPGKTAPVTAGEIIAETVETMLDERGL
ncbi:MAG: dipicolinate synthase subunit A [Ruminococcus sp.]|nr:dipicolinate synthase subunit A [Ruminococcus sp.]